ncbi:MAG: methyltransferase domain-containing protein [Trebonia sp.]
MGARARPAPNAQALDVGCGAGLMAAELARAGLSVTGVDSSATMVQAAAARLRQQGLADRVTIRQADARGLPFNDGRFGLVVALGLLPWLPDPETVVRELARVLAPGGWIILTADNLYRLNRLVDPRENPWVAPLAPVKRALQPGAHDRNAGVPSYRHSPRQVDELLARAGIRTARRTTVGYGPFTVVGRPLLPDPVSVALHKRLQHTAAGHPRLRATGWHYMVVGTKSPAAVAERRKD